MLLERTEDIIMKYINWRLNISLSDLTINCDMRTDSNQSNLREYKKGPFFPLMLLNLQPLHIIAYLNQK